MISIVTSLANRKKPTKSEIVPKHKVIKNELNII